MSSSKGKQTMLISMLGRRTGRSKVPYRHDSWRSTLYMLLKMLTPSLGMKCSLIMTAPELLTFVRKLGDCSG